MTSARHQGSLDELDAAEERARAAAPLRAWFAGDCQAPEPVSGLGAALEASSREPVDLSGDELEYLDQLFGERSPFDPPIRSKDSLSRTKIRDGLLARRILVEDSSHRGTYSVLLAPDYIASIGVACLASRSTSVRVLGHDRDDFFALVRSHGLAVGIERPEDDQVRLTVMSSDEGARSLAARVPRAGSEIDGPAGDLLTILRDSCASAPLWVPSSQSVAITIRSGELWLKHHAPEADPSVEQQIDSGAFGTLLADYVGEPGPAAAARDAAIAAKREQEQVAAAARWQSRSPWRQIWSVLVAVFHVLDWVTTLLRAPFPPYYQSRRPAPSPSLPAPPPVCGLTPDA